MKNLYWKEREQLGWRINIPVLESAMPEILRAINVNNADMDTLFVRGAKSNYIADEDIPTLKSTYKLSELITIPDAGHWVHAEKPADVLQILQSAAQDSF
jgi:esterase